MWIFAFTNACTFVFWWYFSNSYNSLILFSTLSVEFLVQIENQTNISKWKQARNDNGCEIFMEDVVMNKQATQ